MKKLLSLSAAIVLVAFASPFVPNAWADKLELKSGDRIAILGGTFAERMQQFGHFETLLHQRFPELKLTVQNLGFSADTITVRLRSKDFQDHGHNLTDHKPTVILACFGFNESFAGAEGLKKFEQDLAQFVADLKKLKYNSQSFSRGSQKAKTQDHGEEAGVVRQIVLVSPIAAEDLPERNLTAGQRNNDNLGLYTAAMERVAKETGVLFADLFTPTKKLVASAEKPLTFNGVHLTDNGYRQVAPLLDQALFGPAKKSGADYEKLRAAVNEKNLQFWYDYRAINGFYIYGGRKKPFGVVNFPVEFRKLRNMILVRDRRIWDIAAGKDVPQKIDDSETGSLPKIKTNIRFKIDIHPPEQAVKSFRVPKDYKVELFASEVDFPELENPVQLAFDAQGRLWVCTMPSYPMYEPGTPVNDKILILEDIDGDGKADKKTVFADGLHVPTGIELGHGGVYVAQQPNVLFLKDTDGDDRADVRRVILHGFDSADSHHAISAFEWGPGGALYFQEGTFHHSQIETPYGPQRLANAGVFRYEPVTEKLDVFVSYNFANPWGHVFNAWGQNFVADASGGANYFGTAFSGQVDHPQKHRGLKHFLKKQYRPTAGCELVSSRNFPKEAQGNYLLNNCIGFQGVAQYRVSDDDSGYKAEPVEPLLRSSDRNFRPVDLQFGPDGALYVVDWFNPLVGHMQHSLRDPNRDKNHGRIWRIRYTKNPLVKPPKIAGQPLSALLDLLRTSQEDRTRYRVRRELGARDRKQVKAELEKWVAALDKQDSNYQHHLLEALWVHQHHHLVNEELLSQLLRSPDYRARAAATRVLCYWRDDVKDPLKLLQAQVNDEHPRVRLEAVRALSFFHDAKALDVALESLIHPQDYYLKYTLKETTDTLEGRLIDKK